jgi:hypothetical protein
MTRHRWIIAFAMLIMAAFTPAPAAAAPPVVWLDVSVNKTWPVRTAATVVDRHTRSRMVFGKARAGARCVVIRETTGLKSNYVAVTRVNGKRADIKLSTRARKLPYGHRRNIAVHEIAHALGIYTHNAKPTSVMYYRVTNARGSLLPCTFTVAERRTLARN